MKKKHRIIRDLWCGYKIQVWNWWFPFWVEPYFNTFSTKKEAIKFVKDRVVWEEK